MNAEQYMKAVTNGKAIVTAQKKAREALAEYFRYEMESFELSGIPATPATAMGNLMLDGKRVLDIITSDEDDDA